MSENERPKSTREAVRHAAAVSFLENGYSDTSIQDIADRLGIPKGSAYHHVQSKEQILYEVLTSGIEELIARLEAIVEYPLRASERLRLAIWDNLKAGLTDGHPAVGMALQPVVRHLTDEHRAAYIGMRDRYQALFVGLIEEGIAAGQLRPVKDPKIAGFAILGMLSHAPRWFRPDGPLSVKVIAEYWWDLVFSGLHLHESGDCAPCTQAAAQG
jgi:AcrR family transcriptional regulator